MSSTINMQTPSWNDLVFENRNKEFGAYLLRSQYHRNIGVALISSFVFVFIAFCLPRLISAIVGEKKSIKTKSDAGTVIKIIDPVIIKSQDKPVRRTSEPSEKIVPKITTKPDDAVVGLTESTTAIQDANSTNLDRIESDQVGGVDSVIPIPVDVESEKPVTHAEVMPSFDGGLQGLYKFLNKNLHYPTRARQLGTEGTVFIQFVVDRIGNITQVEVIKGLSPECDREAVRVISQMPAWKPGFQNNQAVSVKMILPIYFKLLN